MTTSNDGRVIVSGPGYIKELIDLNEDGVFDDAILLADFPASGAQGLCVDGQDLLVVGDNGLWRLESVLAAPDGKQNASQSFERLKLLSISTEGEHHAHAIRKGPDGFWYLMAGNMTRFDGPEQGFAAGPIAKRRAGFLLRISPDFSQQQFVAHGFRNAYDFAFNSLGQLFTFDSDGERDISMPWYRPTRVFEILPGDDAGWVNKSWKRPSYYFDMPKTLGDAGRGSPTGVVCYSGQNFPAKYRDCVLAGDWTFGRIIACFRDPVTDTYESPVDFLSANNDFALPVTDLAVALDGSLLVAVGGRGTAGGVYRISYQGTEGRIDFNQPAGGFKRLAFRGNPENQSRLAQNAAELLNARRISNQAELNFARLADAVAFFVARPEAAMPLLVERHESLIRKLSGTSVAENANLMRMIHVFVRQSHQGKQLISRTDLVVETLRHHSISNPVFKLPGYWIRNAQLLLGGAGGTDGVFSQFTAVRPGSLPKSHRIEFCKMINENLRQSNLKSDQHELARLMTMLRSADQRATEFFVSQVRPKTPVDDDVFWLSCIALSDAKRDTEINEKIASDLLALNEKVVQQNRATDLHWNPLLTELAAKLMQVSSSGDAPIADMILASDFGKSEHVFLFDAFPDSKRIALGKHLERYLKKNPDRVAVEHIRVMTESMTDDRSELLRSLAESSPVIRNDVILALAPMCEPRDRTLMAAGLESFSPAVVKASAIAIRKSGGEPQSRAIVAALNAACRLGNESQDVSVRDQLIMLLRELTGQQFGYKTKQFDRIQNAALEKWRQYVVSEWPERANEIRSAGDPGVAVDELQSRIAGLEGDAGKGRQLFSKLQCAACHGKNSSLGPRLEGVTRRLNQRDLLLSILNPDLQVSDRYRATIFETVDGFLYRGTVIYESADGVTLREPTGKTVRLNSSEILDRQLSRHSMMPSGLLTNATDQEICDLLAWLKRM